MTLGNGAMERPNWSGLRVGESFPLAVVAVMESALVTDAVVYETGQVGRIAVACSGGRNVNVTMTSERVTWRSGSITGSEPVTDHPLRQMGRILGAISQGRAAFGYLGFQVAYLLHGRRPRGASDDVIAHFIVPDVELRWDGGPLEVYAVDPALGDAIAVLSDARFKELSLPTRQVEVESEVDRTRYEPMVNEVLARIRAGVLRKAIISRKLELPFGVDLARSFNVGRQQNTPARSFLFRLGTLGAMGFSPEIVLSVDEDGFVLTEPLAGTKPLGANRDANRAWREELYWDPKECYEHVISVRLAAEELASVCDPDTVMVRDLIDVRERGTVQHLGSRVSGRTSPPSNPWGVLEAVFPAVTASGIPKGPALETIDQLEPEARGAYGGAVCVVEPDGSFDSALVLRSIFQTEGRTWLQAGAGVVEQRIQQRSSSRRPTRCAPSQAAWFLHTEGGRPVC